MTDVEFVCLIKLSIVVGISARKSHGNESVVGLVDIGLVFEIGLAFGLIFSKANVPTECQSEKWWGKHPHH
jgi:hypothetical protein